MTGKWGVDKGVEGWGRVGGVLGCGGAGAGWGEGLGGGVVGRGHLGWGVGGCGGCGGSMGRGVKARVRVRVRRGTVFDVELKDLHQTCRAARDGDLSDSPKMSTLGTRLYMCQIVTTKMT